MKQQFFKSIVTLSMILLGHSALSENYTGKVYPLEGGDKVLFNFTRTYKPEGDKTIAVGEYKSPDGKVLVREDSILMGHKVLSHAVQQNQKNESGKVTVEGNKVSFSYTREGKEKKSEEDASDNLVVSSSLVLFIQANWDKIIKGETVKIRYASLDRRETVGFDLFKVDDERTPKDAIAVKMKPTSFIIAAIVNPLFLYLDSKTKYLKEIRGRTAPYTQEGTKWNELDAHTVYELAK
jgi:hypothetical protein